MSKEKILSMLKFDARFVHELIEEHGGIGAIKILKECYNDGPISERIPETTMSLMIWNITHSLERLEEIMKASFSCVESIQHLSQITEDDATRTISRGIVGGIDLLEKYVTR